MSLLTPIEKVKCEKLFQMKDGYVCDFSNDSFGTFICESIGVDVYDRYSPYANYSSKAKKLRHLWSIEESSKVGKLILDLCGHTEAMLIKTNNITQEDENLLNDVRAIGGRLRGENIEVSLPKVEVETLSSLTADIKLSLERNNPEFVLDRLHTFATKMLRKICLDNDINVMNPKGEHLPLHSLVGMLAKSYSRNPILKSDFSVTAIKNSISLFDNFNEVRNQYSYAHDNDVLHKLEAEYIVKIVAATLSLIDEIEKHVKLVAKQSEKDNLPDWDNFSF